MKGIEHFDGLLAAFPSRPHASGLAESREAGDVIGGTRNHRDASRSVSGAKRGEDRLRVFLVEPDPGLREILTTLICALDGSWQVFPCESASEVPACSSDPDDLAIGILSMVGAKSPNPLPRATANSSIDIRWLKLVSKRNGAGSAILVISDPPRTLRRKIRAHHRPCRDSWKSSLTARQRHVLRLIARGHTLSGIARRLGISPKTADAHRENIKNKLGLETAAEVRAFARTYSNERAT